jgi:hypothetical protein
MPCSPPRRTALAAAPHLAGGRWSQPFLPSDTNRAAAGRYRAGLLGTWRTAPAGTAGVTLIEHTEGRLFMAKVQQPVTDDSIKVRQVNHYQFSWVAGEPTRRGTFTLQLVLDEGAWEEVLTVDAEDADVLQDLLTNTETVHYDVSRRTLMFGVTRTGK